MAGVKVPEPFEVDIERAPSIRGWKATISYIDRDKVHHHVRIYFPDSERAGQVTSQYAKMTEAEQDEYDKAYFGEPVNG